MHQKHVRVFAASTTLIAAALVAWLLALPHEAPAADAPTFLQTQTLYLNERFTQSGPTIRHDSSLPPESLLTLRGEREGFQVAVNNTTGGTLTLGAHVTTDHALVGLQSSGQITFETARVGFVHLPQGSSKLNTKAGMYTDPLPPIVNSSSRGRLQIPTGKWGGVAVIAKVRTDAPAGLYSANVELFTGDQSNPLVHARVPFTLEVRNKRLLQVGESKSFKTVINVEGESYWLQHPDMRNRPQDTELWPNRMEQLTGLYKFLDTRNITPLEMSFGNPSASGPYNCSYTDKGLGARYFGYQVKDRYFAGKRDIDPGTTRFPARMVPAETFGCITSYDQGGAPKAFHGTIDKYNTPSVKQDDVYNTKTQSFVNTVDNAWKNHGLYRSGATYVKHPFDEPGDADSRQRTTMSVEVPKATKTLNSEFGSRAKVMLTSWPRDSRSTKVCRPYGSGTRCTNLSGDTFDNRVMWDKKGNDDPDVWAPPFSRLFGRTTPANVARDYKVDRTRDYSKRLKSIRNQGKETWSYNFYTATTTMPQVTIDAPGTDARLQYYLLAWEGHSGLFISNLMLGWGGATTTHSGSTLRRKGNPYDQALYFKHPQYGYAAGWGTFIYPGYSPALGLDGETRRNTEGAVPVSSLRLEGLRDGTEEANLIQMYRAKIGQKALDAKIKSIFPANQWVVLPSSLGNVVAPKYSNGNNLAMRMQKMRRDMILELT